MVQYIDEHANVKRLVVKRQSDPVEANTGDGALRARQEFRAGDAEPGDRLRDELPEGSITAPDVEERGCGRKRSRQFGREHVDPTPEDKRVVNFRNQPSCDGILHCGSITPWRGAPESSMPVVP